MRVIKKKKHNLNLILNNVTDDLKDPTIIKCTFSVLDFEESGNNVIVEKEAILEAAKTLKNKPIVGKYEKVSAPNEQDDNFKGHEEYLTEDKYGNVSLDRDTVPIGVFTSEGYLSTINVDGEEKEVLCADGVLWKTKFPDAIDLILDWYERGINVNTSCEYLYKNYSFVDGVEIHHSPIIFEAHAVLASEDRGSLETVSPAYKSARLLSINELNQFKQLVAQAINQEKEKEDNILEDVKNEELEVNEMENQTNEEEFKSQVNELSYDDIRELIRSQAKSGFSESAYVWVADVFETYAVLEVEEDADWKFYKFNYSLSEDKLNLDLNSKEEVKIKREWVAVVEELQAQLNDIKLENEEIAKSKEVLAEQLNQATETIVSLNSTITELKPYQELALNAQREEKLVQLNEKFSKAFNNAGAKNKFDSEEVQNLLKEAVHSTDALLSLNTMVVDLITEMQVNRKPDIMSLGLNSTRQSLLPDTEDEFEKVYKI